MPPESSVLSCSVIVPFHRGLTQLERCLGALASRPDAAEIIVASDGAEEPCEPLAVRYGARVVRLAARSGPAAARNRAAAAANGAILIFVDSDVVVARGALEAMLSRFAREPGVAAIFGTYDDNPACPDFFSQYKNLTHAFVHRSADRGVASFWAGFGGIRAGVFASVGGFDERFTRPCIEDIELGGRLAAAGHCILVDNRLHACHLKRWTFRSMVVSDIRDRGVPWTRLILSSGRFPSSLNIEWRARASVILAAAALLCLCLAPIQTALLLPAAAAIAAILFQHRRLYAFLAERRGWSFAVRGAAVHLLYHLYNGVSFGIGAALHYRDRWWPRARRDAGAALPSDLPPPTCRHARR